MSKLFAAECRYSAGPTEPFGRRYEVVFNACGLYGADTFYLEVIFPLMQTTFFKGPV